jgi:outer membrane receptor protein involved in Fe transport
MKKKNLLVCLSLFYILTLTIIYVKSAFSQEDFENFIKSDHTLEIVTVESERPQWERTLSPGSMSIVIPDKFKGEQKNLSELLDAVPGLFVYRATGSGQFTTARIRGSTSAQVNVYVDGVLQNLGNDIAVDLSLIPVSQIARVEVYRGYTPVRFSGTPIGGVINVVTKMPKGIGVDASVGVASLNTKTYNLTATMPTFFNGALLLGAHYDSSENNFKYKLGNVRSGMPISNFLPFFSKELTRAYNEYSNKDFLLKWQNENFSLKAGYKKTERMLPNIAWYGDKDAPNGYGQFHNYQTVDHQDLVLGYRNTLDKLDLGMQLTYLSQDKKVKRQNWDKFPGQINMPGTEYDNRKSKRYGAQFDVSYKLTERNLLEFHADISDETLNVDANAWNEYTFNTAENLVYPDYSFYPRYTEKRWHLQLQDTITFGQKDDMKLTLSLRRDAVKSEGNHRSDNKALDSWGVAFKKEINPNVTFRSSYGTFNRYPNFAERFGDGFYVLPSYLRGFLGNFESPTWERGEQADVGLELRYDNVLGASFYSSMSYFNRYTKNLVVMHMNQVFAFFRNTGEGRVEGIEFEGGLYWDFFDLDASFTWQRGKANRRLSTTKNTSIAMTAHIPYLPQNEGTLRGTLRLFDNVLSIFAEYHYTGPLFKSERGSTGLIY